MELASLETIDRGSRRGLWLIVGSASTLPAISNLKSLASCLALTSIAAVLTRLAWFFGWQRRCFKPQDFRIAAIVCLCCLSCADIGNKNFSSCTALDSQADKVQLFLNLCTLKNYT